MCFGSVLGAACSILLDRKLSQEPSNVDLRADLTKVVVQTMLDTDRRGQTRIPTMNSGL